MARQLPARGSSYWRAAGLKVRGSRSSRWPQPAFALQITPSRPIKQHTTSSLMSRNYHQVRKCRFADFSALPSFCLHSAPLPSPAPRATGLRTSPGAGGRSSSKSRAKCRPPWLPQPASLLPPTLHRPNITRPTPPLNLPSPTPSRLSLQHPHLSTGPASPHPSPTTPTTRPPPLQA